MYTSIYVDGVDDSLLFFLLFPIIFSPLSHIFVAALLPSA